MRKEIEKTLFPLEGGNRKIRIDQQWMICLRTMRNNKCA